MAVIKSAEAPAALVPFSMRDIENQGRAILLRARVQAERLLAEAQKEADALKAEAGGLGHAAGHQQGLASGREEGLKAGREQGLAEERARLTSAVTALTQAATAIDTSRRQLQASATADVIRLAIAIAERVTKRQGVLDPGVAVANVQEAMKLVVHASDVRIAIHPNQKSALDSSLPSIRMNWPQLSHVEIVEDAGLAQGGCRIYTRQGLIDGDLDQQLKHIVADLLPAESAAAAGEAR